MGKSAAARPVSRPSRTIRPLTPGPATHAFSCPPSNRHSVFRSARAGLSDLPLTNPGSNASTRRIALAAAEESPARLQPVPAEASTIAARTTERRQVCVSMVISRSPALFDVSETAQTLQLLRRHLVGRLGV